jgi:hypothetical protein
MASAYVSENPPAVTPGREAYPVAGAALALFLAFVVCLAIYLQRPPAAATEGTPPQEFSSLRAMKHLQIIARTPHPMGSKENHAVRDYIIGELAAQGADAQVQTAGVIHPSEITPYVGGTVQNVVGRLKGTGGGKAVLLMGHYDSAPTSPGASDDGAAVAALLETARALKAGPPLRNDVIFLLTDGEEVGLLGSKAFVDEHPWAKDVGVVFNFEARGNGGPSIMFETSPENGRLIREFAESSPYPFANSFSYEIYKRLPNDTDFTVMKAAGLPGLNFAYISGLPDYHTVTDSVDNIDQRSLQHQGSYAFALARHFGNLDAVSARESNAVYFDVPGGFLVRYSGAWILPLAILALALFAGVVILGLKRGLLTVKGIGFGFLALALSCVAANVIVSLVWALVRALHSGYQSIPWGDTYNSGLYAIGFVFLTVAIVAALYGWCRRRTGVGNLTVGALLGWLLLAVSSAFLLPGGSYLLTLPLLFALAGTGILFYLRDRGPLGTSVVLAAYAIPAIMLAGPLVYWLFVALTVSAAGTMAVLLALLLGLLVPHLDMMARPRRWLVPAAAAALSLAFIAAGLLTAGFDRRHPRMNNVFYGLNADTGKATWGSIDESPDEWTAQFFPKGDGRAPLPDLFPLTKMTFIESEAPAAPLAAPQAALVEERRDGEVRTLRLRITSPRQASSVSIYTDENSEVVSASINGKVIGGGADGAPRGGGEKPWGLHYYGLPAEGADLTLAVKSSQPVRVRVDDRTYGLPTAPGFSYRPRPEHLMPMPSQYSDATLVSKSYVF